MTVEEIRESLLPWQREVFDWAMANPSTAPTWTVVCRGRRSGLTYLRAAIDEARRVRDVRIVDESQRMIAADLDNDPPPVDLNERILRGLGQWEEA